MRHHHDHHHDDCVLVCRFHVLLGLGEEEDATPTTVPGNALVVDPKLPFRPLTKFGNSFLNR